MNETLIPDENELKEFLDILSWAWDTEEMSAKDIAKYLKFGEPEPGYPQLKVQHIYYFVKKYGEEYGMYSRRKIKEKEVQVRIPYAKDMSLEVAQYLRGKGLLVE